MPNSSFADSVNESAFITDKRGKVVYFPWGMKRKGYILDGENRQRIIKRFNTIWAIVLFATLLITSKVHDFSTVVINWIFCFLGVYFIYFLFVKFITRSLSVSRLNYYEIRTEILESENPESEDDEELDEIVARAIASKKYKLVEHKEDKFFPLKRFYYRYSGLLIGFSFGLPFMIALIYIWLNPKGYTKSSDEILLILFIFLLGIPFFLLALKYKQNEKNIFLFLQYAFLAVVCWGFALFVLYQYLSKINQ